MDEYTPTTAAIRYDVLQSCTGAFSREERSREFDRWLAEHDAHLLEDYADQKYGPLIPGRNLSDDELSIRERAAEIRKGAGQ